MIAPTAEDIGRSVTYRPHADAPLEDGVITSINDAYVFVRFGRSLHSQAVRRGDLEWAHGRDRAA